MSTQTHTAAGFPARLAVIESSTRPGRVGPAVATWFSDRARSRGLSVDRIDLAEIDLPFLDEPAPAATGRYEREHTRTWSARITAADAVAIVTPEYNGSFPAPVKNALDFLYTEWAGKPVGLVGYGMGSGGAGAVDMLERVVIALRMVPAPRRIAVDLRRHLQGRRVRPDQELEEATEVVLHHLGAEEPRRAAG